VTISNAAYRRRYKDRFRQQRRGYCADDIPYLFERFSGGSFPLRDAGGAGIGLAIVKELIEAHGGTVGVESDENGTRVWFKLP